MKRLPGPVIVAFLFFNLIGCESKTGETDKVVLAKRQVEHQIIEEMRMRESVQDEVASKIYYIRDSRTDLCFAYYWGGHSQGGPALATVPCSQVQKYLSSSQ